MRFVLGKLSEAIFALTTAVLILLLRSALQTAFAGQGQRLQSPEQDSLSS
jgi:hypothetical protein